MYVGEWNVLHADTLGLYVDCCMMPCEHLNEDLFLRWLTQFKYYLNTVLILYWPEMLSPRGQRGLEAKILASASVSTSKLWPWPQTFGIGLALICSRRTSTQEEMDEPICLYFALPTTGHHTVMEVTVRERMRN